MSLEEQPSSTPLAREHPYADFLHRVRKPNQYIGGEHGAREKNWDEALGKICLAFPDLYEIGMSHLGYKILYGVLNGHPKLLAERAYAPWSDMEAELRTRGEKIRSLESAHALCEFDVVGFSLQFELTYTNVLLMLEMGGIPLRSANRGNDDPLVLAGGPTATHAEPLADFIDAFLIGDGEERTPEVVLTWSALKRAGVPRAERLRTLAKLGGIYVPALYTTSADPNTGTLVVDAPTDGEIPFPVRRAFLPDLSKYPFPHNGPVAATETIFDRVSVEIARGCTEGCRFCQAGMIYRPVRERDPDDIIAAVTQAVRGGGYDEASLTCLSTADYSAIAPLIKQVNTELGSKNVSLSVSSLRAYGLSEEILDELQKVRASGLTFAPEAGTQRMRDVVNKNVTEAQLMQTAERVFSRGYEKMKLYFMIGLPTEEDDDVIGIVDTGVRAVSAGKAAIKRAKAEAATENPDDGTPSKLTKRARDAYRMPKVTVSVSTHVPKPHTPFQWCAMDTMAEIGRKQSLLRARAHKAPVQLRMHDSRGSWLEGVLARGDRSLSHVIERAYQLGARFDSWEERLKLDAWERAFTEGSVNTARFLDTIPVSARLPWDHIDVGLEDGFLLREYRKAVANRLSPPCGKAVGMFVHHTTTAAAESDPRRLVCYDCGVACDMTAMRAERLTFLRKLDKKRADVAPTIEPVIEVVDTLAEPVKTKSGQPGRIRLEFRKMGRAAYSSHLDLVRLFPRLFRRLDVPLYYSQGFHPIPEMVFGPALALGTMSTAEYVDVKIEPSAEVRADLCEALNQSTIDGIYFTGMARLGPSDPSVSRVITEATYVAGIPRSVLRSRGYMTDTEVTTRLEARRAEKLVVRRTIDGIGKDVEVSRYVLDLAPAAGEEDLRAVGMLGDLYPIQFRLAITQHGTAKPQELVRALLDPLESLLLPQEYDLSARFVRTGLFGRGVSDARSAAPSELEAFRTPHSPPRTSEAAA